MSNIAVLQTPLVHSGFMFQTHVHIDNILETLGVELTRGIVNDILGKKGLFIYIPLTLAEENAYTTLNDLYRQAIENNASEQWQDNINYLIEHFESRDII